MGEDVANIAIDIDPIRDPQSAVGQDVCGSRGTALDELTAQIQDRSGRSNSAEHLQALGVQLYTGPQHTEMGPIDQRRASFPNDWSLKCPISADRLAEAGFFYLGGKDVVKCFHCGIGLHEWEEDDDPWVEHAKKAPSCNFLKLNKSQTFIDKCRQQEVESRTSAAGRVSDADVCKAVNEWLASDLVQQLVSLNLFSQDLIKAALNRRFHSHQKPFESFSDLYEAVTSLVNRPLNGQPSGSTSIQSLNIREIDNPSAIQSTSTNQTQPNQSNVEQSADDQTSGQSLIADAQPANEPQLLTKAGEDPKPENRLHCKICYLAEIEVVFLPCGHQLACSQCAQRLTDCPVCRQPIKGYVRTFFP